MFVSEKEMGSNHNIRLNTTFRESGHSKDLPLDIIGFTDQLYGVFNSKFYFNLSHHCFASSLKVFYQCFGTIYSIRQCSRSY